jgi:hypothetical protein
VNSNVYLHEVIYTVPGREEPYAASVVSLRYDPSRRKVGGPVHPPLLQGRTAETSGEFPRVINIWENTWQGQAQRLAAQFRDERRDTAMEDWWNRNLHLRRGGYDRLLIPAAYSPSTDDLAKRRARAEVVLHEILWLPFGEPAVYLRRLQKELLPAAKRLGIDLLGAFRVAMRPRQVLVLLGARKWAHLARFLERSQSDRAERGALSAWTDYRERVVARAETLVLLPVRSDLLAGRNPRSGKAFSWPDRG